MQLANKMNKIAPILSMWGKFSSMFQARPIREDLAEIKS
jgi:hypothetical protein